MLPKIHLGTLITVTDSHLATQSRERKQAMIEARMNRNTEGFYVYQTYLKRLRRMHRAYVAKFKQQNKMASFGSTADQSPPVFDIRGNYIQTRHFQDNILVNKNTNNNLPWSKHRISLAGHLAAPNTPASSPSESLLQSPSLSSQMSGEGTHIVRPAVTFAGDKGTTGDSRSSFSIHIPCGREGSFDLSPYSISNDKRQGNNSGALPFRMWKQRRDQSGLPSVYSQTQKSISLSGELGSKPGIVMSDKSVPRTVVVSKSLLLNTKK